MTIAERVLHLLRVRADAEPTDPDDQEPPWKLIENANVFDSRSRGKRLDHRPAVKSGILPSELQQVPVKKIPVRVAKYDVNLRESSLRAAQAMHTILSRMLLFVCNDCNERFPTFHPAYAPPPAIAKDMEILKAARSGVAACNVCVAAWDEFPALHMPDGVAQTFSGTCLSCQRDMNEQARLQVADEGMADVVGLRSAENHMDPCFRFPYQDLNDLFAGATVVEAMLVALEHMQINFVTVASSGLRKFRRNTLSFPQDIATFAQRLQLMKNYRINDRVNSVRGMGIDPGNPDRAIRRAADPSEEDRARYSVDSSGALVFPARVVEIRGNLLVLRYEHGGEGLEKAENVTPRLTMPWHPKDVPLRIMLRRNIGRGKGVVEGLEVRWWYVANLLQALCAFPRHGYGPWRLGGKENEPMHKYYDPGLFHIITDEDELKREFAPVEVDGIILSEVEKRNMGVEAQIEKAVDIDSVGGLIAAGFDVNFVGPEEQEAIPSGDSLVAGEDTDICDMANGEILIDEETFRLWLSSAEFPLGHAVQKWWARKVPSDEGAAEGIKMDDDETEVEFFQRILADELGCSEAGAKKKANVISLRALTQWLQTYMGSGLGEGLSVEAIEDDVMLELNIASRYKDSGAGDEDRGCVREDVDDVDVEEEALRTAERLVYGWPSSDADPTRACSLGRFVKAFPLDFPMGIGDLYEDRPRAVTPEVWVQHLLRYKSGHFVGGLRGQRVLWAMVNTLLLSEARRRGFGIYRNVIRRVGLGLEGGRVMTKGRLRELLHQEDRMRMLVGQLANVGREVRSTTMQWAYESKKLDATVKHLSWVPPWVGLEEGDTAPPGRRFLGPHSIAVDDVVGLGRHPSQWWTMNCKYNAAYDVQRMNTKCKLGDEVLDEFDVAGGKRERFLFVRENPDLVAYMLALRTELLMRVVMPAVVRHNEAWPYMSMARFETGPTGNPHYHGFSVGLPGPRMKRVHDDLGEQFDLPPEIVSEDAVAFLLWFDAHGKDAYVEEMRKLSEAEALDLIRRGLSSTDDECIVDAEDSVCHEGVDEELLHDRMREVLQSFTRRGIVERSVGVGEVVT